MANLRIERLNKSYGATRVLDDINLAADDREFLVQPLAVDRRARRRHRSDR